MVQCLYWGDDVISGRGLQHTYTLCVGHLDHTTRVVHWTTAILLSPGMNLIDMLIDLDK